MGKMITRKTWAEFRDAGLLWWVNRALHLFGWAIVVEVDEDTDGAEVKSCWPARVRFRGFDLKSEEEGFIKVTKHLGENVDALTEEVES